MLFCTLRNDKDWRKCVFGRKSVDNRQVAAFFLQLIANEILAFRLVSKQPKIVLARDPQDEYVYESVVKWEGFDFRYPRQESEHSFEEFLRYPAFEALKMGRNLMKYNNATCRRQETEGQDSTIAANFFASARKQSSTKQTRMESFFAPVANESDNDSEDENNESGDDNSDDTSNSEAGTDDE